MELWEYSKITTETSISYRGRYLDEAVTVEMVMDDLLLVSLALKKEDQMWLHRVFFGRFAFGTKAQAIGTLSQPHDSLPPRIPADQLLLEDLQGVVAHRNRFAHDIYNQGSSPTPPETIRFCSFESGENKYHTVSAADFDELLAMAVSVRERLRGLLGTVMQERGAGPIGRGKFPTKER
jgi:hypothetical protein